METELERNFRWEFSKLLAKYNLKLTNKQLLSIVSGVIMDIDSMNDMVTKDVMRFLFDL
jgi:hypothetical protein